MYIQNQPPEVVETWDRIMEKAQLEGEKERERILKELKQKEAEEAAVARIRARLIAEGRICEEV
jgi:hypothetical protein